MSDEIITRRLAAILSADAVGYSRLMAVDEMATVRTLREHITRMKLSVAAHRGRVVDAVGDNMLGEFASVVDAATCAAEMQRDLAARNAELPESQRMPFRIGLHLGDVIVEGDRIRGDGVNVAARLEALAPHGGLAVSGAAFDQIADKIEIEFDDQGERTLKNIPRPVRVYVARLGTEVDPSRGNDIGLPDVAALPRPRTRFIGRGRERREIAAALSTDRLLTLTGVGGCGKSRLALQVAEDVRPQFLAGVRLAQLSAASSDAQLVGCVANAVGGVAAPLNTGVSLEEQLLHVIGEQHLLLILDNCEHVVEGAAHLADVLLSRCAQLAIVATSREPLDIDGERVWQLSPLEVPLPLTPFEEGRQNDAVQLFADRAAATRAGFSLTPDVYGAVQQICQRLDGIPLALELAASRVRHLTPEVIAARLDDRFRLLTARSRGSDRRHQTLLATIEWSDGLLTESQRTLLYRLSVFRGSFALEAVEAVCSAPPLAPAGILEHLGALVDRSLVEVDERRSESQYKLLETIRAYAEEKLDAAGERDALRTSHRDWFAKLAEDRASWLLTEALVGSAAISSRRAGHLPQRRKQTDGSPADIGNLHDLADFRAAAECSLALGHVTPSLRLAGVTGEVLLTTGRPAEAVELTERALSLGEDAEPAALVIAQITLASALIQIGDFASAFDRYEAVATAASREPSLRHVVSMARSAQSVAAHSTGKGDPEVLAKLAVEAARECGYEPGELSGLLQLGATRLITGRFSDAAEIFAGLVDRLSDSANEQYVAAAYDVVATVLAEDERGAARAYQRLTLLPPPADEPYTRSMYAWTVGRARALWCATTGDLRSAKRALIEALELQRRAPMAIADADYLVTAAVLAFFAGNPESAARCLGAARGAMQRFQSWRGHDAGPIYVTLRKRCEDAVGSDRARGLSREGRSLDATEALRQLRSTLESPSS